MYQTVYYHKTVAAFELMLKTIYSQLVSSSIMPDLNAVFASEDQFCKFDDHYVWTKMAEYAGTNNYLKELITMLRTRQPINVVFDETSLPPDEDTVKKQSRLLTSTPRRLSPCTYQPPARRAVPPGGSTRPVILP